jgi:hypothetical protein
MQPNRNILIAGADGFIGSRSIGEVTNLGSNFESSRGDDACAIAEVMGFSIDIIIEKQRLRPNKSEVERLFASSAKALELLDWQPQYSGREGFMRGVKEIVAWFGEPSHLAAYKADIYNLLLDESLANQRDAVLTATNDAGLTTRPVWTLMPRLPMYGNAPKAPLPVAESLERRLINIPSSSGLVPIAP